MVVGEASVNNIMGGIANTGVKLHCHKRKLKQRFDIIKKLGQGTYGKVQLGINKETGQEVAIKTIKKSKIETEADLIRIRREIQIMSSVRHPNIVHIYEVFENREKMVLVMEYAAGGELYDYLSERKVLAEEEARRIFRQIAIACYYCHKHKICHRDLKLENILLDEKGNAKIADFGLSNVFDDTRLLATFCGSPLYASPEIVKGTPYHGPEVDCWSLGVLLYTLVYGAMPFDGSNFKRLVKQISQGDYFEPKQPSPASPLIKEMLTVNPKHRADIEKICAHWWVNESYDESALDISEFLANQTPVRLDYLLSLAPPPPQLESDKLVVTGDVTEEPVNPENVVPTRSQSAGSLMELSHPAEKRIKDLLTEQINSTPKRKLESTVSTDQLNRSNRKDKIVKENTIADISVHATIHENASLEDASMPEAGPGPLDKSRTQTISRQTDLEPCEEQGAACAEIIEESKKNEAKKPAKIKTSATTILPPKKLEEINENPSQENLVDAVTDKENKDVSVEKEDNKKEADVKTTPVKRKVKKVLGDKIMENAELSEKEKVEKEKENVVVKEEVKAKREETEEKRQEKPENKPLERRRSRIYEQAEKFQNLIAASESKPGVPEKPKKVVLPGVSVDGYKKQFERKCSLTSTSPPKTSKCSIPKRISLDKQSSLDKEKSPEKADNGEKAKEKREEPKQPELVKKETEVADKEDSVPKTANDNDRNKQLKNAVSVITSVLEKEGARKSKSRPCIRKPPVPFGASGRSASGSIAMISSPLSPEESITTLKVQIGPNNDTRLATVQVSTPELIKYEGIPEDSKVSSAEITLKSATLPRRKTTKAEIHLNYPQPKAATMEFKTEMAHRIEAAPKLASQRSEALFPVSAAPNLAQRSASVEPDTKTKERIIPIAIEKSEGTKQTVTSPQPPPVKPPTPKVLQNQKSYQSQRSNSLSRQSTQESDSETTVSGTGEPIRKSPREYIIPIAVEGGGYVTPRAGSLEPSDTASTTSTITNSSRRSKFSRNAARRMNSLLSDRDGSEDESPFNLHRHNSFGRDSGTEESRKDSFPMHRLRSSRPMKANIEHADSMSSGEDDDEDGFDILTAENLFSTLLSRVKDLTQKINVDERPGFPSSRLLSHFDHGTNFWNFKSRLDPFSRTTPLGRTLSQERSSTTSSPSPRTFGTPWRRSVSRDLAADIDSVFNESRTPTQSATLPRGDTQPPDDLNLSDLNLKQLKLSDEDAIALSYLTPGLSKRIQKQLLAQLPPSEARKLTRTMSMRSSREKTLVDSNENRKSLDRSISTLPRRLTSEHQKAKRDSFDNLDNRPRSMIRSTSLREPGTCYVSSRNPDSNISDSVYKPDDTCKQNLYTNDCVNLSRPSYSTFYSPESSTSSKYLSPKYTDLQRSYSPTYSDNEKKTDSKIPSTTSRKTSRFLRPDFYDRPKDESTIVKEKKEREMETQKVLKEIRDKRKSRLNLRRERSRSRETSMSESTECKDVEIDKKPVGKYKNEMEKNKNFEFIENGTKYKTYDNVSNNTKCVHERDHEVNSQNGDINGNDQFHNVTVNSNLSFYRDKSNNEKIPAVEKPKLQNSKAHHHEDTDRLLTTVSDSIKTLETNIASHDYVNVPAPVEEESVPKKEKVSRLIRPKSYPTDALKNAKKDSKIKVSGEKDSIEEGKAAIDKVKENTEKEKIPVVKGKETVEKSKTKVKTKKDGSKVADVKNKSPPKVTSAEKSSNKNRFLQSIEKKFEKLRGLNNTSTRENSVEKKTKEEKKSNIENAIRKLREQSLPRNMDHCITESGLIKRAVSVEDLTTINPGKELQPSRKSVTKILGLFKKYEEKDKKNDKGAKLKKPKDLNSDKTETNQLRVKKNGSAEKSVIPTSNKNDRTTTKTTPDVNGDGQINATKERPKSMFYDSIVQTDDKLKGSKLPVNAFRRSLNLEKPAKTKQEDNGNLGNACVERNNNPNTSTVPVENSNDLNDNFNRPDRAHLKLDLTRSTDITDAIPSTSSENRNSTATDDSSLFLSPCDDNMSCDSWSVCSDYHTNELMSPNGHLYSGDENESVIDRIRRKSFYTRFNEKKKPRKTSLSGNYRDLDLYKDYGQRKTYRTPDYSSLDRRSVGYRFPTDRRVSYSSIQEPTVKKEYKPYTRSSTLLNDYVNVPNRYQTYNPRLTRHISSLYSPESDDSAVDDVLSAGKSRLSSYHYQPSRLNGRASTVSPSINKLYAEISSSSLKPTSGSPSQMT